MASPFSTVQILMSQLTLSAQSVGGRNMLSALGPAGAAMEMQPLFARKNIALWEPAGASTVLNVLGTPVAQVQSAAARNPANTTFFTALKRLGFASAAGAGSVAFAYDGVAQWWIGNNPGLGGFFVVFRFGVSDAVLVATANMFVGLTSNVAAPTDVAPSTLTNLFGVGCDSGDTQLQLYAAGAGAQARTALGANFPVNTVSSDVYEVALYCAPNGAQMSYMVTRLNTGDVTSGTIIAAAQIPANNLFLSQRMYRSNGGTAAAVAFDLLSFYGESDH